MKRLQSIGFLLSAITGLSVLLLVSVFSLSAKDAFDAYRAASHDYTAADVSRELFIAKEALRLEQGVVATALATASPARASMLNRINGLRVGSQALYESAVRKLKTDMGSTPELAAVEKTNAAVKALAAEIRNRLKQPGELRPKDIFSNWMATAGAHARALTEQYNVQFRRIDSSDPFMVLMRKTKGIMGDIRDGAGGDRARLAGAITAGEKLSATQLQAFAETMGGIDGPWNTVRADMLRPSTPAELKAAVQKAHDIFFVAFRAERENLIRQMANGYMPSFGGQEWLLRSNPGMESITAISTAVFDLTKAHAAEKASAAAKEFYFSAGTMLVSLLLAALTIIVVTWRIIRPLRLIAEAMETVADGDLVHNIPFKNRHDEIGRFARALRTFRDNALEKQQMEAELLQNQVARDAAEASNRVKSEFLANMSHELRTPLNAVIGFSDLMKQKMFGPLSKQYEEYAVLIHESGQLLLNLVSDILDIAKIEAGKFTLDIQDVNLTEAVYSCLRLIKRRAEERHVVLKTCLPEAGLCFAADPRAFKQMLLNLLSNAVKFTGQGGQVEISGTVHGQVLRLIVRDNGIGIPAGALSRIGHAFEQASNDPTRAREGTGLGLALVRALVDQHGGKLSIESIENVGTTVTIEMPLSQEARIAA